jgi:hypothetical protein
LVVDGDIVDLNSIPLPADTPIIDQRFKERHDELAATARLPARTHSQSERTRDLEALSELSGVLRRHPEYIMPYYLELDGGTGDATFAGTYSMELRKAAESPCGGF